MAARRGLIIGLGVALVAAPAFAQPAASPTASTAASPQAPAKPAPPKRVIVAQAAPATARQPTPGKPAANTSQPGVPRTLAEALAVTYSTQPALGVAAMRTAATPGIH